MRKSQASITKDLKGKFSEIKRVIRKLSQKPNPSTEVKIIKLLYEAFKPIIKYFGELTIHRDFVHYESEYKEPGIIVASSDRSPRYHLVFSNRGVEFWWFLAIGHMRAHRIKEFSDPNVKYKDIGYALWENNRVSLTNIITGLMESLKMYGKKKIRNLDIYKQGLEEITKILTEGSKP